MGQCFITRRGSNYYIWRRFSCDSTTKSYYTLGSQETASQSWIFDGANYMAFRLNSLSVDTSSGTFDYRSGKVSLAEFSVGTWFVFDTSAHTAYRVGRRDTGGRDDPLIVYADLVVSSVYHTDTTYTKGSTDYGYAASKNANTYPTNGRHSDGDWYIKQ